nr:DUF5667 domain-containing protein [Micromonospora sp. DSM 115978]
MADRLAAAVRSPRRRRATRLARPALVGALASSVAVVGLTVGAQDALPGEPLYSVKRQVEQIQVTLAGSETARARAHLDIARTRLDEMQSLLGSGGTTATAEIPGLLGDWEREARSGGTVLVEQAEA